MVGGRGDRQRDDTSGHVISVWVILEQVLFGHAFQVVSIQIM